MPRCGFLAKERKLVILTLKTEIYFKTSKLFKYDQNLTAI
jgi:hypothetical protein